MYSNIFKNFFKTSYSDIVVYDDFTKIQYMIYKKVVLKIVLASHLYFKN